MRYFDNPEIRGDVKITGTLKDRVRTEGGFYSDQFGEVAYKSDVGGSSGGTSDVFYLNDLRDVNAPAPSSGQVLKWNGSEWAPAADNDSGGGGGGSGFYGITVKHADDSASFRGINVVAFNEQSFYLTQNDPNTDEVVVNFRGASGGGGGVTDHGGLTGLTDDDHTQYVLADGSRAITGRLRVDEQVAAGGGFYSDSFGEVAYKNDITASGDVTGGANVGSGGDNVGVFKQETGAGVLQFRSLSPSTAIDLTENASTIDVAVDETAINHDNLNGFVANEHIDWTQSDQGTIPRSNLEKHDFYLNDAQDVNAPTADDNDVLAWDAASGKWTPQTAGQLGLSEVGHSHTLGQLNDVKTVLGASDGDIFRYNGDNSEWEAQDESVLKEALGFYLNDLRDVNAPAPTDGQVLKYVAASNEWQPGTDNSGGGGGITSFYLNDAQDVNAPTGITGRPLTWNGSEWVDSTSQLRMADGSSGAPAYSFTDDSTVGMFHNGNGKIWLNATTSSQLRLDSNQISILPGGGNHWVFSKTSGLTGQRSIMLRDSQSTPQYTFGGDEDTGIYQSAADTMKIAAGGAEVVQFREGATAATDVETTFKGRVVTEDVELDSNTKDLDIDFAQSNIFRCLMRRSTTLHSPQNVSTTDAQTVTLVVEQPDNGFYNISWGANYIFPGGGQPTLTQRAGAIDVFGMITMPGMAGKVMVTTAQNLFY